MKKFILSFYHAFNGIFSGFQERNMRVHGLAFTLVILLGIFLQINLLEWIIVLFCSALVMSLELVNTAIEELANTLRDELKLSYSATTRARDTAAAAVLVSALISALIGVVIFLPKIINLFYIY